MAPPARQGLPEPVGVAGVQRRAQSDTLRAGLFGSVSVMQSGLASAAQVALAALPQTPLRGDSLRQTAPSGPFWHVPAMPRVVVQAWPAVQVL